MISNIKRPEPVGSLPLVADAPRTAQCGKPLHFYIDRKPFLYEYNRDNYVGFNL
jgi:hypothetical protein